MVAIKNKPNKLLEKRSLLFLGLRKDNLPFSRTNNSAIHEVTGSKSVLTVSRVRNVNEREAQGHAVQRLPRNSGEGIKYSVSKS